MLYKISSQELEGRSVSLTSSDSSRSWAKFDSCEEDGGGVEEGEGGGGNNTSTSTRPTFATASSRYLISFRTADEAASSANSRTEALYGCVSI